MSGRGEWEGRSGSTVGGGQGRTDAAGVAAAARAAGVAPSAWTSGGEEETLAIGRGLAAELAPDGVLLLSGDLGTGKTVLARGVASGLGIAPGEVQSPTYTLVREHEGRGGRLVHVDLYRLGPGEVEGLGLEELLTGPGVKVVEWAERLPFPVEGALALRLDRAAGGDERHVRRLT